MSDQGFLQVSYLGTAPPAAQLLPSKGEVDYERIDREH